MSVPAKSSSSAAANSAVSYSGEQKNRTRTMSGPVSERCSSHAANLGSATDIALLMEGETSAADLTMADGSPLAAPGSAPSPWRTIPGLARQVAQALLLANVRER